MKVNSKEKHFDNSLRIDTETEPRFPFDFYQATETSY